MNTDHYKVKILKKIFFRRSKGYMLLILLIFIGILQISLFKAVKLRVHYSFREKEKSLISILREYHTGIYRYLKLYHKLPLSFKELNDSRCIRRVYKDPFTEKEEWALIKNAQGIMRVQSKSPTRAIDGTLISEWHFDKKGVFRKKQDTSGF